MSEFDSSFAADLTEYLDFKVVHGRSRRSLLYYLKGFDRFLVSEFPDETMLTEEIVLQWAKRRGNEGAGNQLSRIGAIRGFGSYLCSKGLDAFVAPRKLSPKQVRPTPRIISDEELARFFDEIDKMSWPNNPSFELIMPVIFRLIYTCGLRPSEGRTIKASDINASTGEITLRKTKGYKERVVVMSEDMSRYLKRYLAKRSLWFEKSEWLFPGRGDKPLNSSSLSTCFKMCWEKANQGAEEGQLPKACIYSLRHRFASAAIVRWMNEGQDVNALLPVLQAYLGHEDLASTAYYIHILPENVANSKGVDWAHLEGIVPEVG